MGKTKRQQNKCKACGYTWYPRGKHLSLKCPNCGSSKVSYAGTSTILIGIAFLIFIFFANHQSPAETSSKLDEEMKATPSQSIQSTELVLQKNAESFKPKTTEEKSISTNVGKEMIQETNYSPSEICKSENNFISHNNCMWKECEKAEFSELQECADKKTKNKIGG